MLCAFSLELPSNLYAPQVQTLTLQERGREKANISPDGFDDDAEGTAPCGGFTVGFDNNVTDFHVDGDSIAMLVALEQLHTLYLYQEQF